MSKVAIGVGALTAFLAAAPLTFLSPPRPADANIEDLGFTLWDLRGKFRSKLSRIGALRDPVRGGSSVDASTFLVFGPVMTKTLSLAEGEFLAVIGDSFDDVLFDPQGDFSNADCKITFRPDRVLLEESVLSQIAEILIQEGFNLDEIFLIDLSLTDVRMNGKVKEKRTGSFITLGSSVKYEVELEIDGQVFAGKGSVAFKGAGSGVQ